MKKYRYIFGVVWCAFLMILLLAASTDLFIDEEKSVVYRISVIWDSTSEEYISKYKTGMESVTKRENIELNYAVLPTPPLPETQVELMLEEVEKGAQLLVVKPVDEAFLQGELQKLSMNVPIICIGSEVISDKVITNIRGDEVSRGRSLMKRMEEELDAGTSIYILDDKKKRVWSERIIQGMKDINQRQHILPCQFQSLELLEQKIDIIVSSQKKVAFVALDSQVQEAAVEILKKDAYDEIPLYGFGYSDKVISLLEEGGIRAVNIHSDYYMGWLGVKTAIEVLKQENPKKDIIIEDYTIGTDEIFTTEFESILFAID